MSLKPGRAYPLGATYDGAGVNFSIFSSVADRVELCLFDEAGLETRFDLPALTGVCWHGYFPALAPGQRYGYRVHGPWQPAAGLRCNPAKLLLDPHAKCIHGALQWHESVFPHYFRADPAIRNDMDSAPYMPQSLVIDSAFDWEDDHPPRTPWDETIIYEAHVKGLTIKHPDVPAALRGTYSGLAHPAVINHLKILGITAVELLPVHQFVHDMHLLDRGVNNYWGYNTIGFFAPHGGYAVHSNNPTAHIREFKYMVKALHKAGLEVILDVVYGHTAEGNHLGPVLSFKGIDNAAYYRLDEEQPFYYKDFTGTGNSLNIRNRQVLQFVMDSLRYWVVEMHVDGFRFDLAASLARGSREVDLLAPFFDVIHQDPIINQVKLIAEPWDVGEDGYKLGYFPALWSEWNGKFRDCVRKYWRGGDGTLNEFSLRLAGSPDLFRAKHRSPRASINFVTCHDGFTLSDLVSYGIKHNAEDGEANSDGENANYSRNCGIEGATSDASVNILRARQRRNLLATLLLSQGVPMLLAGDELGRSQAGNNNAYCQDNDISWLDWQKADYNLYAFCETLITLRRAHPAFRRAHFRYDGVTWYRNDGDPMTGDDWNTPWARAFAMFIDGSCADVPDDDFYLVFNAHCETIQFIVPRQLGTFWRVVVDTAAMPLQPARHTKGIALFVTGHSLLALVRLPGPGDPSIVL